jgi:hypothetical protein
LAEKSKLSAILVNEAKMDPHTAFSIYADVVVPVRELVSDGLTYRRPKNGLLEVLRQKGGDEAATAAGMQAAPARARAEGRTESGDGKGGRAQGQLAQAERAVLRITSRAPKTFVARKAIERQLQQINGFKKTGPNAYLGKKHYQGLMTEIARLNKQIRVQPGRSQSASVMYVPE